MSTYPVVSGEKYMVQSTAAEVSEGERVESPFHPDLLPLAIVRLEMDDKAPDRTATVVA